MIRRVESVREHPWSWGEIPVADTLNHEAELRKAYLHRIATAQTGYNGRLCP